jgi:hypothetical protein
MEAKGRTQLHNHPVSAVMTSLPVIANQGLVYSRVSDNDFM